MKILTKFVLGSLLGISLTLTGTTQAKADNCLLIICVDAPILGPVVGTVGDVVEGILTPSNPAPPVPPVKPPVQPPVQPPVNPPVQPPVNPPAQPPTQPGTTDPGTTTPGSSTPSDSGNTDEIIGITDGEVILPTTRPTPTPSPSPSKTSTAPRLLPDDDHAEGNPFAHVGVLTPFIVGVILMLLIVLSATSAAEYVRSRRKVGIHDTSALPHKK